MMISGLDALSQTTPSLILPNEITGKVRLNISTFSNFNIEKLAYDYLSVFVKNDREEYRSNAVQGRFITEKDYLVFTPYFPFEKGMTYVIRTKNTDANGKYSYQSFELEKKEVVDKAEVISIYPSANELPENLLRFYLYFNTPMKKGQALKHIQLVDAAGNIDKHAFMEFKQELWSPDGKRLTILFDPGRIKKGVSTNIELGPALLEDKQYQLIISSAWQDVYGQELSMDKTKEFEVIKAYRQTIKVDELEIQKPEADSKEILSIHFDRIVDHALVQSMIQIKDENEKVITGYWQTSEEEKIVQFIPEEIWQKGMYLIIMDNRLEDAAGNNLNNLLDQKAGEKSSNVQKTIRRFTI